MPNRSSPSDRQIWLKAEHRRLSELLDRLAQVIGDLESAPFLKRDAAARLDKYRENRERQQLARKAVEFEMQRLDTDARATTPQDELLEQVREKGPANRDPLRDLLRVLNRR